MLRKTIDFTSRTTKELSLSRAVIECVETLSKDWYKLIPTVSIPCIFFLNKSFEVCTPPAIFCPTYNLPIICNIFDLT